MSALAGVFAASPARADEVQLTVELTDVELTGTTPASEIVLSGRVTNHGTLPAYVVQAIMWRSTEEVADLATYREVVAGGRTLDGSRLVRREANYANLTGAGLPFAPGASGAFTIRATLAESGLTRPDTAYLVGVDVRGNSDGSSTYQTFARSRTLVPLPSAGSGATTVPVVLMTSKPSHLYGTYFADDHLAAELAPAGRLSQLLDLVVARGLDYVLDPGLHAEVTAMSSGYTVRTPSGGTTTGTGASDAATWLTRVTGLPAATGYRTLFAVPDIEHAARFGEQGVLARAQQALVGAPETIRRLPVLAVPAGLQGTDAAARFVQPATPQALLTTLLRTDETLVTGDVPLLRVWTEPGDPVGVQRALAHRLAASTEAMILGTTGQPLVRVISTSAAIADEVALPAWVTRVRLAPVLASTPSRVQPTFAEVSPAGGLPQDWFNSLGRLEPELRTFAELAPKSPPGLATDAILARGASSAWVGRATDRAVWLQAASVEATTALRQNSVQLNAAGKFVMSSNVNEFPVTITNRLPYAVLVMVRLDSSSPQRLQIMDTAAVTVNPGESRTVNVRPEAITNGVATVTARLATESGTVIGTPIEIIVESTQFGLVGWAIVIVSGIVLVATTAWSIKKSKGRTRAKEKA